MSKEARFEVTKVQRLDSFLSQALNETRNQVSYLIKQGAVKIDNRVSKKPGVKLKIGQSLHVSFPELVTQKALEINFDVEILFEDDDILVINKPSGLTVHPAPSVKEATLVDWLIHKGISLSTISGEERHGIVHRLDKGTSGVMVVAKNNAAHEHLSQQLQDKSMGRYYLAVITPPLKDKLTMIEAKVGRSHNNRLKMADVEHGKEAKTLFSSLLLSKDEKMQLIGCKLFTGRTHQIRAHLETKNRHILGDHLYGIKSKNGKITRIMLHAYIMYLKHPKNDETVYISAPIAAVIQEYLNSNFDQENLDALIQPSTFSHHFDDTTL
ncbi:MAG: RluA family pseudouridine synthase [Campylobacterota bacterium]|nr:RluA family pseudouridine synthase [Campylobacterota bacterium]